LAKTHLMTINQKITYSFLMMVISKNLH